MPGSLLSRWRSGGLRWVWIAAGALIGTGCASHADYVDINTKVSHLAASQEQAQKQQEAVQKRLHAIELKLPSSKAGAPDEGDTRAERQRVEGLAARLKALEDRLARLEDTLRSQTVMESKAPPPESGSGEGSSQSKPARLQPLPPAVKVPGTPDITPTSAFNLALNDYQSGRYELALSGFQKFLQDFPSATLAPDAHYWLGETYYSMRDYVRASQAFEHFVTEYPRSDKVPPALYKLGLAASETGDSKKARGFLKRVIEDYKDSNEAKLAKNRLADLR